jgi:hypothetical protein
MIYDLLKMVVYMLLCHVTDMVYIGQAKYTAEKCFKQHVQHAFKDNSSSRLSQALRRFGEECFEVFTLETCDGQEQLNACEIWWINYCCSREHAVGYNDERGGNIKSVTEATREKCRQAGKKGIENAKVRYGENYFKECAARGTPAKKTSQKRRKDMTLEELQRYAEWGKQGARTAKAHRGTLEKAI